MKKLIAVAVLLSSIAFSVFASESGTMAFVEGCKAYSQGDWASAKFMLKKAVSYPENITADTYYMLISAEINDGDDRSALDDCNIYLENFSGSIYYSRIAYQKGKVLYNLGEYEKSIIALSDFCHQNEKDDMYSYALFYIGESLFAGYKYDDANAIFNRVVTEYPDSPKAAAAQYRIDSINQRVREEKLLYLLKQTGEEYLSAKEEYEKQLRLYNSESINNTRQKLMETQARNEELERQVLDLEQQISAMRIEVANAKASSDVQNTESVPVQLNDNTELDVPSAEPYDETKEQLKVLRQKALEAQKMLEEQSN